MSRILLRIPRNFFELGIPVLGLCYGAQLMMHVLGGKVITPEVGEYGKTERSIIWKMRFCLKGFLPSPFAG